MSSVDPVTVECPLPASDLERWSWDGEERGLAAEAAWRAPATFEELAAVMVRFLRGEICETPSHCGPTDEETEGIADYLVEINRAGFMTCSSQPTDSGWWGEQFAYVEGFAPGAIAKRISAIGLTGTLGVGLTAPGATGTRGQWGDLYPSVEGFPIPEWISDVWSPALSARAFAELGTCWHLFVFDTNDHDPMRLWRRTLEALVGPEQPALPFAPTARLA